MKLGIDISTLCKKWDGIGSYLLNVLEYLNSLNDDNEYYLYADRPLEKKPILNNRFFFRIDNGKNHLLWLLTRLPKQLKKDGIEVFWQPNFIYPVSSRKMKIIVTIHDMSAYAHSEFASAKTNITHKLFLKKTCDVASTILVI